MVMKYKLIVFLIVPVVMGISVAARASQPNLMTIEASDQLGGGTGQLSNSAVRILQPRSEQVLTHNYVNLMFELVRPNPAGGDNNFIIRLDSRDPVKTSSTEYTFTGLRDGEHIITVIEVDANDTPLLDAATEVHFTVKSGTGNAAFRQSGNQPALNPK